MSLMMLIITILLS